MSGIARQPQTQGKAFPPEIAGEMFPKAEWPNDQLDTQTKKITIPDIWW